MFPRGRVHRSAAKQAGVHPWSSIHALSVIRVRICLRDPCFRDQTQIVDPTLLLRHTIQHPAMVATVKFSVSQYTKVAKNLDRWKAANKEAVTVHGTEVIVADWSYHPSSTREVPVLL
jgi:hypothetical protein